MARFAYSAMALIFAPLAFAPLVFEWCEYKRHRIRTTRIRTRDDVGRNRRHVILHTSSSRTK